MDRICLDCGRPFTLEPEELAFLEELARQNYWNEIRPPKRCVTCRAARRRLEQTVTPDGGDLTIRCVICGADFEFRSRDRQYYAAHQYCLPRRCPACRTGGGRRPG
jgi:hypothetical protein